MSFPINRNRRLFRIRTLNSLVFTGLTLLLLIVAGASPSAFGDETPENLIQNPSFEKWHSIDKFGRPFDWWEGWIFDHAARFEVSPISHSGSTSCQIIAGKLQKIRMFTPLIPAKPGRYRLSFFVRGLDLAAASNDETMDLMVEPGNQYFNLRKFGTFGWTPVTYIFDVAPNSDPIRIHVGLIGGGRIWIDDVSLVQVDELATDLTPKPVWGKEEAPIAPPKTIGHDAVRCPECFYRNPADARTCYACGAPLQSESSTTNPAVTPSVIPILDLSKPGAVKCTGDNATLAQDPQGKTIINLEKGFVSIDQPQDWSAGDYFHFDVTNPQDKPVELSIEIRDRATTDYWTRVNLTTLVGPGTSTVSLPTRTYVGEKSRPGRELMRDAITRLVIAVGEKSPVQIGNFRLERIDPAPVLFPQLLALDFGPDGQTVMEGFRPIGPGTIYTPGRGLGWDKAQIWRAVDVLQPESLTRDYVCVESGALKIDVPDGVYRVHMNIDSPNGYWGEVPRFHQRRVTANGQVVHEKNFDFQSFAANYFRHSWVEDLPGDDTYARYVTQFPDWVTFDVTAKDGSIRIGFEGVTDAIALSALVMYPVEQASKGKAFLDWVEHRRRAQFEIAFKQSIPPRRGKEAPESGLRLFTRHPLDLPNAHDGPEEKQELAQGAELKLVVARGEEIGQPLCIQTGETATQLTAIWQPASTPATQNGKPSAAPEGVLVNVGWIDYRFWRTTMDGSVYSSRPRYLHALPAPMVKGMTRTLWIGCKVPENQAPGDYQSTLEIKVGGATATVPLRVTVLPFSLKPIDDVAVGPLGCSVFIPWIPEDPATANWNQAIFEKSLAAMRRVGCTSFSGIPQVGVKAANGMISLDTKLADLEMSSARAAGFRDLIGSYGVPHLGYNMYGTDAGTDVDAARRAGFPDFESFAKALYKQLDAHAVERDWLPVAWNLCDEPLGEAPLRIAAANAAAHHALIADLKRTTFMGFSSMTGDDPKADHANLVAALPIPNLNIHDAKSIAFVQAHGNQFGFYNNADRWTLGRYMRALVKNNGLKLRLVWHFNVVAGDPYYALDCREDDYCWFNATPAGDLVPSTEVLTRVQPGLNDYRYLLTLERMLDLRKDKSNPAVVAGRQVLAQQLNLQAGTDESRSRTRVTERKLDEFETDRAQVRDAILALLAESK